MPVIISNYHIIDENILKKKEISVDLKNEKKIIYLNDDRKIYMNKQYDVTIIEINPEKDCIYNFLELDDEFFSIKDIEKKIYK